MSKKTVTEPGPNKPGIPPLSTAARATLVFLAGVLAGTSGITPEAAGAFILYHWEALVTIGTLLAFTSTETGAKFQQILEHPALGELVNRLKQVRAKK